MKRLVLLFVFLLAGCDGREEGHSADEHLVDSIDPENVVQVFKQFERVESNHAHAGLISLNNLGRSVTQFLSNPDPASQHDMKQQWLQAHRDYLQENFFTLADQSQLLFQIDAWPIQAGFLDSIKDYPQSGIINDFTVTIDPDSLQEQHGITDSREVSLGFHALEFLIFNRTADDFSLSNDKIKLRRRQVMKIILDLLTRDVKLAFLENREANRDFLSDLEGKDREDPDGLRLVIRTLHTRVQLLFSEVIYIGDGDAEHSSFSRSSWVNLRSQIAVLNELSGQQSGLRKIFETLDQRTAHDYDLTLTEAMKILSQDNPVAEKAARIPLLFAALGHQLGDLEIILRNSANQ